MADRLLGSGIVAASALAILGGCASSPAPADSPSPAWAGDSVVFTAEAALKPAAHDTLLAVWIRVQNRGTTMVPLLWEDTGCESEIRFRASSSSREYRWSFQAWEIAQGRLPPGDTFCMGIDRNESVPAGGHVVIGYLEHRLVDLRGDSIPAGSYRIRVSVSVGSMRAPGAPMATVSRWTPAVRVP